MRIQRAGRWPTAPRWAALIVALFLVNAAVHEWIGWASGADAGSFCLFRRITGWPCPTCGTTRMVLAALGGRFIEAAGCNPLMFALVIVGFVLLALRVGFRRRVVWITSRRSATLFALVFVLAVLANWVYLVTVM